MRKSYSIMKKKKLKKILMSDYMDNKIKIKYKS